MEITKKGIPYCPNDCTYQGYMYCQVNNCECVSFKEDQVIRQIPCEHCIEHNDYKKHTNLIGALDIQSSIPTAYFHIPGFMGWNSIKKLIKLQNDPQLRAVFKSNYQIAEIYGAFPGCSWNGRTPLFGLPFMSIQEINEIKEFLEQNGVNINLTWNNHLINKDDLNDKYCNTITELLHNGKHSITVASDVLTEYLKNKYPNFMYYKSIISTGKNKTLEITKDFDVFLAPISFNNNWEQLNLIPTVDRPKIEFLCNDNCFPLCDKNKHYGIINYCLHNFAHESCVFNNECPINNNLGFYNTKRWPTTINPEDIDLYVNNGFSHFKIASRTSGNIKPMIYKICKYIIKPEFFDDVYFWISED